MPKKTRKGREPCGAGGKRAGRASGNRIGSPIRRAARRIVHHRRAKLGVEGGRSHPLASLDVKHRVGWLRTSKAPRKAAFPPYPYPSETGDRRSWAILWPVSTPKCAWNTRKAASEPFEAAAYRRMTWSSHACMTSARRSSRSER